MLTDNYLGEIRLFSFEYAPEGWHICDGSILNIQQNVALFSLIGNAFGGDGKTTFALPDLRGRAPFGAGVKAPFTYQRGQKGGAEAVALSSTEMPFHNHLMEVENTIGNVPNSTNYLAIPQTKPAQGSIPVNAYNPDVTSNTILNPDTISVSGSGQAHNNLQPFQTVNFCIATQGYYPPRP